MRFHCFLELPLEIRRSIYRIYFWDFDLTYPHFTIPPLLLSSRQCYKEALASFWENAVFKFRGTKHLVDFLISINHLTLCKLHHISVRGYPLPINPDSGVISDSPVNSDSAGEIGHTTYMFTDILPLFPGLQLSTLRIEDPFNSPWAQDDSLAHDATYSSVESFIQSEGFQEVIYVLDHDWFLKSCGMAGDPASIGTESVETMERKPQPLAWDSLIKERDGASASVKIFRLVDNGSRRIPFGTEFEAVQNNPRLEVEGQIEVRIRRGKTVDYVQKGAQISKRGESLFGLFTKLSWKEILEHDLYIDAEDDPSGCLHPVYSPRHFLWMQAAFFSTLNIEAEE